MNRVFRIFAISILTVFSLLALVIAVFESGPGRQWARVLLEQALTRSGVSVQFGALQGRIPQDISVEDVSIDNLYGYDIRAKRLSFHISLIRLLKKELHITRLEGEQISLLPRGGPATTETSPFSITLNISHFDLRQVSIPENVFGNTFPHESSFSSENNSPTLSKPLNLSGRLKIRRNHRGIAFSVRATRPEFPNTAAELTALRRRNSGWDIRATLDTPTLSALRPWLTLELDGPLALHIRAQGELGSLRGKFDGKATPDPLPSPLTGQEWIFRGRFEQQGQDHFSLSHVLASSRLLRLKGAAEWTDRALKRARVQLQSDLERLPSSEATGRLILVTDIAPRDEGLNFTSQLRIADFSLYSRHATGVRGQLEGSYVSGSLRGTADLQFQSQGTAWRLATPFQFRRQGPLFLEAAQLTSPLLQVSGDLAYQPRHPWVATLQIAHLNLELVRQLFPEVALYGTVQGTAALSAHNDQQAFSLDATAQEVYFHTAYTQQLALRFDWNGSQAGSLFAELTQARYEQLELSRALFESAGETPSWPFHLSLEGVLREPLNLALDGTWSYQPPACLLSLENGGGLLFRHSIALTQPARFSLAPDAISCNDLRLDIGAGTLSLDLNAQPNFLDARLLCDQVPLDFLSINPLNVDVAGTLSLEATLHDRGQGAEGAFSARVNNLSVETLDDTTPLFAEGQTQGTLKSQRLQIEGAFDVRNAPLLSFNADLPFRMTLWPYRHEWLQNRDATGRLAFDGELANILDFFNLGTHRFAGRCIADLTLRNTLTTPRLEGHLSLEDGAYQNYLTGTSLTSLFASVRADYDTLQLLQLKASDSKQQGTLEATGSLSLAADFPFRVSAHLHQLNIAELDLLTATAEGSLLVTGDLHSARAQGDLRITSCEMRIPDRLPRQLPELTVVYKHAAKPIAPAAPILPTPRYPLFLDLSIRAPQNILISGRGLQSEWKGDFHLGGTLESLAPKGRLELLSGEFSFAHRTFKLNDGALILLGREREMPLLDISGSLFEKGVVITARLRGPLNRPQLTFQSNPPLPLSGILSYLLFGQDLSELDGFQALQLAATVASLSGEGPDILENTRRSLGVDRLRIIATPRSSEEGGDTLALQVGKYIAKGVIVSITQGTEDASTNISIEVDIGAGFFFQAESQQQQEQGKFSLKWNRNY